jgi:hypothetical protein
MSNLTLQQIITEMAESATTSGFVKVEEVKINQNDTADTEVPAIYIKLDKIEYGSLSSNQFLMDTVLEKYFFQLLIVTNNSENPISDLKTLQDRFLTAFLNRVNICPYNTQQKIELQQSSLTNDRDLYSKLGGESTILSLTIENINKF